MFSVLFFSETQCSLVKAKSVGYQGRTKVFGGPSKKISPHICRRVEGQSIVTNRERERTDDAVHVEVGRARSRHALGERRQDVGLGDGVEDGDERAIDARHDAVALHAELEVRRHCTHTHTHTHTHFTFDGALQSVSSSDNGADSISNNIAPRLYTLLAQYAMRPGSFSDTVSVRLSVPSCAAACGGFAAVGDIDQLQHGAPAAGVDVLRSISTAARWWTYPCR